MSITSLTEGPVILASFVNVLWFILDKPVHFKQRYLAVLSRGCWVPTSFLTCIATLLSSSLSRQRRLMKEVGYPTSFSASDTALFQFEGPELENRLRVLCPRLDKVPQASRDHVASVMFSFFRVSPTLTDSSIVPCRNVLPSLSFNHYRFDVFLNSTTFSSLIKKNNYI